MENIIQRPREAAWAWALLTALFACLLLAPPAGAAQQRADMAKRVGDRAPIFQVVTSERRLMDYDKDYYGRHHLVMTFVPAAFTPV
ncbi:hypothetical protein [Geoalkalibacter halelectricus]|uniref:AhpC/TSA family protein n=1 Tax=Geoalkalibacter halelectricus TaxID=2847045 RepID=A0ABY5ZJF7_9BACT|nr:hypothetical protein [Geoalkalibacter halelectricus]MDO3378236.1 hypothetical protein [Geoalkalibacter halelectricus]UWZ79173.1 hypothetical protein L9S41_16030 [Geoalkalibacter halelectricus]